MEIDYVVRRIRLEHAYSFIIGARTYIPSKVDGHPLGPFHIDDLATEDVEDEIKTETPEGANGEDIQSFEFINVTNIGQACKSPAEHADDPPLGNEETPVPDNEDDMKLTEQKTSSTMDPLIVNRDVAPKQKYLSVEERYEKTIDNLKSIIKNLVCANNAEGSASTGNVGILKQSLRKATFKRKKGKIVPQRVKLVLETQTHAHERLKRLEDENRLLKDQVRIVTLKKKSSDVNVKLLNDLLNQREAEMQRIRVREKQTVEKLKTTETDAILLKTELKILKQHRKEDEINLQAVNKLLAQLEAENRNLKFGDDKEALVKNLKLLNDQLVEEQAAHKESEIKCSVLTRELESCTKKYIAQGIEFSKVKIDLDTTEKWLTDALESRQTFRKQLCELNSNVLKINRDEDMKVPALLAEPSTHHYFYMNQRQRLLEKLDGETRAIDGQMDLLRENLVKSKGSLALKDLECTCLRQEVFRLNQLLQRAKSQERELEGTIK